MGAIEQSRTNTKIITGATISIINACFMLHHQTFSTFTRSLSVTVLLLQHPSVPNETLLFIFLFTKKENCRRLINETVGFSSVVHRYPFGAYSFPLERLQVLIMCL